MQSGGNPVAGPNLAWSVRNRFFAFFVSSECRNKI